MSLATGVSFLVLGLALLLFDPHSKEEKIAWQPLSLAVVVCSLVQFLGYLYGVSDLYRTFYQNPMSVQTATVFLLLGLAMFAARPDRGWTAVFTSPGRRRHGAAYIVGRRFAPRLLRMDRFARPANGLVSNRIWQCASHFLEYRQLRDHHLVWRALPERFGPYPERGASQSGDERRALAHGVDGRRHRHLALRDRL